MSRLNIAARTKLYYESKDFKDNYSYCLYESFGNNESDIIDRIINLFNVSNYETEKYLTNWFIINKDQAKKIYDFIYENFEDFTDDFSGYYVGYTSLESIEFGEQEEQLTGFDYNINYLRKIFTKEEFYVNNSNYAYYNINAGLHIDLLNNKELLNNFLLTIKDENLITQD